MANKVALECWLPCIAVVFAWSIAGSSPAFADFDRTKTWFMSLGEEDRITLQTNLTLAGFYDAFIDGAFGPSTYRGLTGFQEWNGESVTGVLSEASELTLSQLSESAIRELDLQILQDERGQIELAVPRALLPQTTETSLGTAYTRPDDLMRLDTVRQPFAVQSFEDFYRHLSTENAQRDVTYKTYQDGYFVVSGSVDQGFFYSLMLDDQNQAVGFTLNWSEPYSKQGSVVSLILASFATPWSEEDTVAPAPVPDVAPAPPIAMPPSDSDSIIEIGNFLVFEEMPGVIGLRGDIGPSTPLDFRRAVRAVGEPKVLMLASEGGYVSSALLLAYAVREMGLSTYVLPKTGCYSACSFVFFAGKERKADGALGVHQVWGDDTDASTAQTVVSDILEAFVDFGVRQEVTSAMLRTRPEDMYVFSSSELSEWGIDVGDPMALTTAVFSEQPPVVQPDPNVTKIPRSAGSTGGDSVVVSVSGPVTVPALLAEHGVDGPAAREIESVLLRGGVSTLLRAGSEMRILFGPTQDGGTHPFRVSLHLAGTSRSDDIGVALSDRGQYVLIRPEQGTVTAGTASEAKGPRTSRTHYVQLASARSEDEARQAAQSLISRFGPVLQGASVEVQRVDLGASGVHYRVRVPATSLDDANAICFQLVEAGGDCFVL